MENLLRKITATALAVLVMAQLTAQADSVEEFYKGKTITFLVASGPAGSFDVYARLLAARMPSYIPGRPAIVVKHTGGIGGGLPTAIQMQTVAARDGTVIAMTQQTIVVSQMLEPAAAGKFDATTWNWIGLMAPARNLLAVWHTAPAQSVEEAKQKEIIIGATGRVSPTYIVPKVLNEAFGTKFKIVTGYGDVGNLNLAMERGEIHGRASSWLSIVTQAPQYITEKKIKPIVVYGLTREPSLPDVGLLIDLARSEKERNALAWISSDSSFGRSIFAPPGVPVDRVTALRRAFDATMKDPALLLEAERVQAPIEPQTGEELNKLTSSVINASPDAVALARSLMGY